MPLRILQMETQQAVRYVHPDPETHTANKTYTTRSLTPVRPSNTDDKLKMTVDVNGITHITDGETSQYTMEALLGKVSPRPKLSDYKLSIVGFFGI